MDRALDHVMCFVNGQIPLDRPDIEEPHVEIALGRGETLVAAARLARIDYRDAFAGFDFV
jgi:hypothetical protein